MSIFLLKRLLTLIATLLGASSVVFAVLEVLPGDAAQMLMGPDAEPEAVAAMVQQLGLDQPALTSYWQWIAGLLHGNMGDSYVYGSPVAELVWERLAVTVPLAIMAMCITAVLAIAAGVFAAANHKRWGYVGLMGLAQIGIAIPNFWFAILLILLFSVNIGWFSAGGFPGWSAGSWPAFKALILPAVALAAPQAAILARVLRTALLDTMNEDYVRTARAKGLSVNQALWRHALRNAWIPVLTILGLQFPFLLAGGIIIENVFSLPGLGRLVFQAITQRDLIVVQSVVVVLVFAVVLVSFLIDLAYLFADPRLRGRRA